MGICMKRLILDDQQIEPMVPRMCEAHSCTDEPDGTSVAPIFQAFSSFVVTLSSMNVATAIRKVMGIHLLLTREYRYAKQVVEAKPEVANLIVPSNQVTSRFAGEKGFLTPCTG